MTKTEKLKMCSGCEDDFYNDNNHLGVKECWMLDGATPVKKKKVPVNQRPPFMQEPISILKCFNQKGYVFWN